MAANFRVHSMAFLLLIVFGISECALAKKRLRIFRVRIIHYDNSHTKGILYEVNKDGIVLGRAKDLLRMPNARIARSVQDGSVPVKLVAFDTVKKIHLWRRNAAGRNFAIGASSAMVATAAITTIDMNSHNNEEHCGCGPPALLILPPAAAILGGTLGALFGLFPKKIVDLDPNRVFENAREQLEKYSVSTQLQ